jgi:hypothetical protein
MAMGEGVTAPAQPAGRAAIRRNPEPIILAVGCGGRGIRSLQRRLLHRRRWAGRWSAVDGWIGAGQVPPLAKSGRLV